MDFIPGKEYIFVPRESVDSEVMELHGRTVLLHEANASLPEDYPVRIVLFGGDPEPFAAFVDELVDPEEP